VIQPQPAQRPALGADHAFQRLIDALEHVEQRHEQLGQLVQTQVALAGQMTQLTRWVQGLLAGAAVLSVCVLGLVGATIHLARQPDTRPFIQALGAIDQVLAQNWPALPKAMQEQLTSAYAASGLMAPGARSQPPKNPK
jgi:hypothetical protein